MQGGHHPPIAATKPGWYRMINPKCELRNDKQDFERKEAKITLAALRYFGRSSVAGISGVLFCQSDHLFVLWGSLLSVETFGQAASTNDSPNFFRAFRRTDY